MVTFSFPKFFQIQILEFTIFSIPRPMDQHNSSFIWYNTKGSRQIKTKDNSGPQKLNGHFM
uniref:Uncharacterized protein n=1 Tax=Rhizophora mucronata TaxID=61149 RepID=A0A2P2N030_RHIMU